MGAPPPSFLRVSATGFTLALTGLGTYSLARAIGSLG